MVLVTMPKTCKSNNKKGGCRRSNGGGGGGIQSVIPLMLNTCVIVLLTISALHWQGSTKTTYTTTKKNDISSSSSSSLTGGGGSSSSSSNTPPLYLSPAVARLLQEQDGNDDDILNFDIHAGTGDAPHFDDDATRTETCRQFLYQFLNGTTDARDECQGFYNAFKAADCEDDGHHTTLPVVSPSSSSSFLSKLRRLFFGQEVLVQDTTTTYNNNNINNVDRQHKNDNGTIVDDDVVIDDFFENWECCDSIRTYYEKHCETTSELQSARLLGIMLVLLVCTMMKAIFKRLGIQWLPDACIFIMVGAIVGGILRLVNRNVVQDTLLSFDTDLFLQILLPPIIFQAALSIDKRAFRRDLFPILAFASLGTAFSAIAIGLITHHLSAWTSKDTTIPLLDSLVFGSLISSIDPVATLGILSGVGVSQTDTLYTLIFGESLLNDGVAIVLFDTLKLHLGEDAVLNQSMYEHMFKHFVLMLLGSISIGIGSGMCCTIYFWALRGRQSAVTEVMIFFCWALIPYYIADGFQCSGIISIMVMGFFLDYYVIGGFQSEESAWMDYMQTRNQSSNSLRNHNNNNAGTVATASERPTTTTTAASLGHHQYPHLQQQQHLGGFGNTPYPSSSPSLNDRITNLHNSFSHAFSGRGHILSRSRHHVGFVAHVIANLMDTAIFAYLGLFLFNDSGWNFRLNLIAIFGCVSSRAVMVVVLSLLINLAVYLDFEIFLSRLCKSCRRSVSGISVQPSSSGNLQGQQPSHQRHPLMGRISNGSLENLGEEDDDADDDEDSLTNPDRIYLDRRTQVILLLSGIRGAVSFALVENIPIWDTVSKTGSKFKPELKAMTSSSIFFTLFVFGALTYFTVQRQDETRRGSRVAGPLTHRLLSEPLDSGDEGETEGEDDHSHSGAGATSTSLEIEHPNQNRTPYRPPTTSIGATDQQPQQAYRPLTTSSD